MDSIISLGQKNTLAKYMILSGADNRLPMLDKDLVAKDLWERVQLLMQGASLTKQERECSLLPMINSELPLIQETKPLFKTAGLQCNKFRGHKGKNILRQRNAAWYKEKAMLPEAQEAGQILDEEQLEFLADPRIPAGIATVDNAAQMPSAITVAPGMFKLDLEPLAPKLVHNRESHSYYLKHTQEQADIL
nr:hypothetical protein [Tanacetum cinerariifolium]